MKAGGSGSATMLVGTLSEAPKMRVNHKVTLTTVVLTSPS